MTGRRIDVLLVESDPIHAQRVQALLKQHPDASREVNVEHAASLAEAFDHLASRHVDVLVLDLQLPDGGGPPAVERVQRESPGVPVVAFSDREEAEFAVRTLRAGAREYLVKGEVSGPSLWRAIRSSIERVRAAPSADPCVGPRPERVLVFREFALDMALRELRRNDRAIVIHLKPLKLLDYLIRHRDRVVSKEELLDRVWGRASP